MKLLALLLTLLSFNAQAGDLQDYIEVQAQEIQDKRLLRIQQLALDLVLPQRLSKEAGSCGDVITFRGPKAVKSAKNMQLWIHGISYELAALNLDEDVKLYPGSLRYSDLRLKMTLLADRSLLSYDIKNVEALTQAIYNETHPHTEDYYFFFGDYLAGDTGWMTAVVLVKISSGEALLISHSSQCF